MRARRAALAPAWRIDAGEWVSGLGLGQHRVGAFVAAATARGEVLVVSGATGEVRARFQAHPGGVLALGVHPTAPLLATGGRDGHVRLWDLDGLPVAALAAGAAWVERLRWAPGGRTLAVAAGRAVLFLDAGGALRARTGPPRPSTVSDLAWSRTPEQLWSAELGGVVRWDPETGAELARLACPGSLIGLAVAPDAGALAGAGQDTTVRHFRLPGGEGVTLQGAQGKPAALGFSASGRFLAHGGSAPVVLWDLGGAGGAAPPVARLLETHQARVTAVAFAPASERLASGAADGSVAVWDLGDGGRRAGLGLVDGAVSQLAWTPDGERLVAATAAGSVACFPAPAPA